MGHEVFPEGHFGGAVVVAHTWLQSDVQVQLVLGVVLGPGDLFKAVGLCVDELGVLGNRFVWIATERGNKNGMLLNESLTTTLIIHTLTCKWFGITKNNRQETVTAYFFLTCLINQSTNSPQQSQLILICFFSTKPYRLSQISPTSLFVLAILSLYLHFCNVLVPHPAALSGTSLQAYRACLSHPPISCHPRCCS